jgi:hypothetical protein
MIEPAAFQGSDRESEEVWHPASGDRRSGTEANTMRDHNDGG